MSTIYFYNVPNAIYQAFTQSGLKPKCITELPQADHQDTILWYARTEEDIMMFDQVVAYGRKIILAPESLTLENPSVTALLLRQNNVELYYPFNAAHIPQVFAPERHWYSVQNVSTERGPDSQENMPLLFSGSGKDSFAIWGPCGTGKTSVALSLGTALAKTKAKVLLIDVTNTSDLFYRIQLTDPPKPITLIDVYKQLRNHEKPFLYKFIDHLFVIPGNLVTKLKQEEFLHVVDSLKRSFDFILFDISSEPDEIGYTALRLSSRILLVANYDVIPLTLWHENTLEKSFLPRNKLALCLNAVYPSRYKGSTHISDFLNIKPMGTLPVDYQSALDSKLGFTAPYLIGNDEYKNAIDELMAHLWQIEGSQSKSIIKSWLTNFRKDK